MSPTIYPTGVTIHYPDRAHPTLVLFDGRDGKSHLIDMNGNEVRSWPYTAFPAEMIDPALTGGGTAHVFVQKEPDVFDNVTLLELDWDGETVWEYMNPYFGPHGEHGTPTGGKLVSWIFRAQPVPYDWAPAGTPMSEDPVIPPDLSQFRVG